MSGVSRGPAGRLLLLFGVLSRGRRRGRRLGQRGQRRPGGPVDPEPGRVGLGALAAVGIAAAWRPAWLAPALWAAPVGLAASLISSGQAGVHRWVDLGPLHMNAALLLLPAAVVAHGPPGGSAALAMDRDAALPHPAGRAAGRIAGDEPRRPRRR